MDDEQIAEFMGEIRTSIKNIDENIKAINGRLQDGDRAICDIRGQVQGVRQTVYGANGDTGLVDRVSDTEKEVGGLKTKFYSITAIGTGFGFVLGYISTLLGFTK